VKSLRARLSLFLLGAALLAAGVTGMLTYQNTLRENEQLFDYQLRQTAITLRDQGLAAELHARPDREDPSSVVVQIWTANGTVLYLSHPNSALPDRATLGFSDVDAGGRLWRVYSMASGGRIIQVAQPLELRRDLAANAALRSLRPLFVLGPLLALLAWLLVDQALRPVSRLAAEVKRRDAMSLEALPEQGLPSEVEPLAQALNALLARLKLAFDSQRAFVADAAHELRSPLTALKLQLQLLERAGDEGARRQAQQRLQDGVERATRLIEQLLLAARTAPGEAGHAPQPLDLAEAARLAIAEAWPLAQARRIDIGLDAPSTLSLSADPEALRILLRNLLDNAIRYTPQGGKVQVALRRDGNAALLAIEDSGPGIAPEERERVFQRFYRGGGNAQGEPGSGLGLAIVANIAARHGATIALLDSTLGGLRIEVRFPA
jgi:two-component system OmpR family sensor kinase/two-component system sensor histidine kinase QseC